jgi:hypothetical protein
VFSAPNARVKLLEVRRTDTMANAAETSLTVVVGLARPELQLDEPDNTGGRLLAVDLPKPLQTRLFYVSEPDDAERERGAMCDRPRFPHECDLGRFSAADVGRRERRQLLKLTFEDGAYAAVPITVPVPPALPIPELVEPASVPAQGSAVAFAFRDVGAEMTVKLLDGTTISSVWFTGDFDAMLHWWQMGADPELTLFFAGDRMPPAGRNINYVNDAELSALLYRSDRTADVAQRNTPRE